MNDGLYLCSSADPTRCVPAGKIGVPPTTAKLPDAPPYSRVRALVLSGDTLVVAIDSLYFSKDRGEHFENLGLLPSQTNALGIHSGKILIGTGTGFFSWDLQARSLAVESAPRSYALSIQSLRFRPGETYALFNGSVYRRKDSESLWTEIWSQSLGNVAQFDIEDNLAVFGLSSGEVYTLALDSMPVSVRPDPRLPKTSPRNRSIYTEMTRGRFRVILGGVGGSGDRSQAGADGRFSDPR